ncbi:MAG: SPOR domain-containing protein [Proteobacteria bacterium]|nr:SPOR domain-containing protein [Pseudomonadota bacterium]
MPSTQLEQMKQSPQNSAHPVANGGSYSPPPPIPTLPIQTQYAPGGGQPKGLIVNLGKVSLFGIFFSLIIMGALTFLSGFLLGVWFAGPSGSNIIPTSDTYNPIYLHSQSPEQQTAPTSAAAVGSHAIQSAAGQAGFATQSVVSNVHVPHVPSFLAPLVTATQTAVGEQLGHKAQQQVNRNLDQGLQVSAPAAPQQKPTTQNPPLTQPAPSMYPATPPLPATTTPSSSSPTQQSAPKSQSQQQNFTIQLGAYASKENAHALVNHLQALNINSRTIVGKGAEGNVVYFVHSGLYKDYNQALEAASQFANQNLPGAMVVNVSEENKSAS